MAHYYLQTSILGQLSVSIPYHSPGFPARSLALIGCHRRDHTTEYAVGDRDCGFIRSSWATMVGFSPDYSGADFFPLLCIHISLKCDNQFLLRLLWLLNSFLDVGE